MLSSRFVVMAPVPAMESPCPVKLLPPEEDAVTSAVARMTACSTATMLTSVALTSAFWTSAVTSLRTSLSTTSPPIATDGDCVTLKPAGNRSVTGTGFQVPRSV